MIFDLIIVGADSAGLTAGIYAGRKKMNAVILSKQIGGQSLYAARIENYPGIQSVSGTNLVSAIKKQVERHGIAIKDDTEIISVAKEGDVFSLKDSRGNIYGAKTLIIASGGSPKLLGIKGEKEFMGKGVSVCATCDAPFYDNKTAAIIGGGNSAFDSAYDLLQYAQKIYLLRHRDKFIGDELVYEFLKRSGKVEFIICAETQEIKGGQFVDSLTYKDLKTGEDNELKVNGVFVNIGQVPNSNFMEGLLELNKYKEIITDARNGSTSQPGIFAAGDVTDGRYKQVILAAADGAKALLSAAEYLRRNTH